MPTGRAGDAHWWQREAFVVALDPVEIVVARSGITDHSPGDHVAIAPIDGIREKSLLHVLEDLIEKNFCIDAVEFQFSFGEVVQEGILVRDTNSGKIARAVDRAPRAEQQGARSSLCAVQAGRSVEPQSNRHRRL